MKSNIYEFITSRKLRGSQENLPGMGRSEAKDLGHLAKY